MNSISIRLLAAFAVSVAACSAPAHAALLGGKRKVKPVAFDIGQADPAALTKAAKLELLRGVRAVAITQFTAEFVDRSTGLSLRQRDGAVAVNYSVASLDDAATQSLVNELYASWLAGLQAQGISVIGPDAAAAMPEWSRGIESLAKPAPALVDTPVGRNKVFGANGSPIATVCGATIG